MADEYDKRLRDVENKVYSYEQTFTRLADDIHDIKDNMLEFIAVKNKLASIDILFKRIDETKKDLQSLDYKIIPLCSEHSACYSTRAEADTSINAITTRLAKLEFEHENCSRLKTSAVTFLSGRVGVIFDWLFKIGFGVLMAYVVRNAFKG